MNEDQKQKLIKAQQQMMVTLDRLRWGNVGRHAPANTLLKLT